MQPPRHHSKEHHSSSTGSPSSDAAGSSRSSPWQTHKPQEPLACSNKRRRPINITTTFKLKDEYLVDGEAYGNAMRFINHSCGPNCFAATLCTEGEKKDGGG